jgi:hypothetical protein
MVEVRDLEPDTQGSRVGPALPRAASGSPAVQVVLITAAQEVGAPQGGVTWPGQD